MKTIYNIAIDGPAGAGKSTIAREVARRLRFVYVDTGAMYRAIALYFSRKGMDLGDEKEISREVSRVEVSLAYDNGIQQVLLNGENVSSLIRTPQVGAAASVTSAYPAVREKLTQLQKELAKRENIIMDGRDIGTCVLPHADLKVHLTASAEVRAKRRYEELQEKGETADLASIEEEIKERDYRDMHREISPLTKAEDAVLVDTSSMTIEEVVECLMTLAEERGIRV